MIEREDKEWGVRLVLRPFQASGMQIQAEISKTKRNPEIRIVFTGVPIEHPLVPVEAQTWCQALTTILAEAKRIGEELKRGRTKK
jgi:hypothetical protein